MDVKLNLSNEEHKELVSYCNLNDLLISSVVKKSFTTGFNIERYGLLNADLEKPKEKIEEFFNENLDEYQIELIFNNIKIFKSYLG